VFRIASYIFNKDSWKEGDVIPKEIEALFEESDYEKFK